MLKHNTNVKTLGGHGTGEKCSLVLCPIPNLCITPMLFFLSPQFWHFLDFHHYGNKEPRAQRRVMHVKDESILLHSWRLPNLANYKFVEVIINIALSFLWIFFQKGSFFFFFNSAGKKKSCICKSPWQVIGLQSEWFCTVVKLLLDWRAKGL